MNSTLTAENKVAIRWEQNAFKHYQEARMAGAADRFVFTTLPVVEEGEYKGLPSPFLGGNHMAICKTSQHKDWAWEFIRFISTDEVAVQWVCESGAIPNNRTGMELIRDEMGDKVEAVDRALGGLPEGFNFPTSEYFNNADFGPVTAPISLVTNELLNNTKTPEEGAQELQQAMDSPVRLLRGGACGVCGRDFRVMGCPKERTQHIIDPGQKLEDPCISENPCSCPYRRQLSKINRSN